MVAEITKRDGNSITVSVTVRLEGPMLEAEEAIQEAVNEVGMALEQENLVRFDTDGSPIKEPIARRCGFTTTGPSAIMKQVCIASRNDHEYRRT